MFKVGDRVRCVEGDGCLVRGKVYEVTKDSDHFSYVNDGVNGCFAGYYHSRFEMAGEEYIEGTGLLEEADSISDEYSDILRERAIEYGAPEEHFAHIAMVLTGFLGAKYGKNVMENPLTAAEVAVMLGAGLKGVRAFSPIAKDDTFGDLSNYSKLGHALYRRNSDVRDGAGTGKTD